jgi:zeaxanthin glucosyltransferase
MTHFGLICAAATGHLNTMLPLGQELQRRGHRVTLFGLLDARSSTLAAGLGFRAIGESVFPSGAIAQSWMKLGKRSGFAALRDTVRLLRDVTAVTLRDAPNVIKEASVDALLVDQVSAGGSTIADFLEIPFVTVCSAVVLNQEESTPPPVTNWRYNPAWWARLRNRTGYLLFNGLLQPIREVVAEYRRQWGLPAYAHPNDAFSQLAQISQQPAELEFSRRRLPPWFHFTGPYHTPSARPAAPFPFEKLTGQPLIYACMGSIVNQRVAIFRKIAQACVDLDPSWSFLWVAPRKHNLWRVCPAHR